MIETHFVVEEKKKRITNLFGITIFSSPDQEDSVFYVDSGVLQGSQVVL